VAWKTLVEAVHQEFLIGERRKKWHGVPRDAALPRVYSSRFKGQKQMKEEGFATNRGEGEIWGSGWAREKDVALALVPGLLKRTQ